MSTVNLLNKVFLESLPKMSTIGFLSKELLLYLYSAFATAGSVSLYVLFLIYVLVAQRIIWASTFSGSSSSAIFMELLTLMSVHFATALVVGRYLTTSDLKWFFQEVVLVLPGMLLGSKFKSAHKCHWYDDQYILWFFILAAFKGVKIVVHTFSYYLLNLNQPLPENPTVLPSDVTVIIPTITPPSERKIQRMIESIAANNPRRILISTVGRANSDAYKLFASCLGPSVQALITIVEVNAPNKRAQLTAAADHANTRFIAYADDSVWWPTTYLRRALAPFEDADVGLVGTVKQVQREKTGSFFERSLNYIACIYLERHNFECTASCNVDGGVFVISGRTAIVRSEIVQSREYQFGNRHHDGYLNERWGLYGTGDGLRLWGWGRGKIGPLAVDDDNFTTRYMVNHGKKTIFLNHPECTMYTTLGTTGGLNKFKGQLLRWARTTWRSNPTSLIQDRTCYKAHPWTTFAMFFGAFFNFALIYDSLLVYLLYKSSASSHVGELVYLLFLTKLVKPLPHLRREPWDIFYAIFVGIPFGYFHSFIKFWAMCTAKNIEWTGR